MAKSPSLDCILESTVTGRNLPVRYAADFLEQLQLTLNHIGDYLAGGEFRTRGRSTDAVRARCELVFEKVAVGSLKCQLALSDEQMPLEGVPSLGVESIEKFYQIIKEVEEEEEKVEGVLSEIIEHPAHRARIIEDLARLWPGEREGYRATVSALGGNPITLKPAKKLVLEGLLSKVQEREVKSVIGVLGTVSVMPSKFMKIVGPDGKVTCSFSNETEELAKKLLGRPVIAKGIVQFDAAGNMKELIDVSRIEAFTSITIQRIFTEKAELRLKEPLVVSVDYQDNYWVMENEDLNIIASAEDYDDCLKEFHSNVYFIYTEYGLSKDSTLSPGARELKRKIRSLVKEQPNV